LDISKGLPKGVGVPSLDHDSAAVHETSSADFVKRYHLIFLDMPARNLHNTTSQREVGAFDPNARVVRAIIRERL
jgi:hypothetical protein